MQRQAIATALFFGGVIVGLAASGAINAQAPAYVTKEILRTDLQNLPGQEVLIFTSEWQPGFRLPWHIHPNGHEFTYVVEGEQTFEVEGVGTKTVRAGEVLYTPPNTAHFGRNATGKVSMTLVVRIKDKDKPIMIEVGR